MDDRRAVGRVVLLVEDNPDDRDLTIRAFARHQFANAVETVSDGQAALDYLHASGPDGALRPLPEIVLLDLKLPKVDGLEVLRRIRASERTRVLPVVVLTSSAEEQDLVQSYALGANSYVRKPVSFTEFIEASRQLGMYWLVLNRPPPRTEDA
jgi:two-component system response regulator